MDLTQMKAAVTMEGVLSGTVALELIAEVERLEADNRTLTEENMDMLADCTAYRNELSQIKDLVYGEHGLNERLKAADAGWAKWQTEATRLTALCDGYRGEVAELKAKMESGLMHNCNICGAQMSVSIAKDGSGSSVSYAPESINAASRALAANAVFGDATPKIAATIRARATKGDSDEG